MLAIRHTHRPLLAASLLLAAAGLAAQTTSSRKSPKERAGAWFLDPGSNLDVSARVQLAMDRMSAVSADADTKAFVAAVNSLLGGSADGKFLLGVLIDTLPRFSPIWDKATPNKALPGAVAKYAGRLKQVPRAAVDRWEPLVSGEGSAASRLIAAMSLSAEDVLFPNEEFSQSAFDQFISDTK